jgi:dihydroxyacid dehydratase/phosphogluconate dehydratase
MRNGLRSRQQYQGPTRSLQRAWIKGAGLTDEDLNRPLVAVDFSPENAHLRRVADAVKAGIYRAGGTPCEFNAFHVTDSETIVAHMSSYRATMGRAACPSSKLGTLSNRTLRSEHRFHGLRESGFLLRRERQ